MALREYPLVHGREYRGIVYRIDTIPSTDQYRVSFNNPHISSFIMDKRDRFSELEKEAESSIDEYLDDK